MIAQGISENRYLIPRWLVLTLLAVVCWGLWAIISKLIGDTITASQSQALSTVGVIPVMLVLSQSKKLVSAGNRRRGALNSFIAGALCCGGNVAYYHALNVGGKASNVVPLTALYPLVTVLLAVVFLREILSPPQFIGIGLSLVAIYLFNGVGVQGLASSWLIYAMIPIALWGVSALLQKISTNDISGELSALWFLAAFVPCAVVLLILQPLNLQRAGKDLDARRCPGFILQPRQLCDSGRIRQPWQSLDHRPSRRALPARECPDSDLSPGREDRRQRNRRYCRCTGIGAGTGL
jgi:transporter family protein